MEITTIGLDLANSIFQVHSIDGEGKAVVRRSLVLRYFSKLEPYLVGIGACATGTPFGAGDSAPSPHGPTDAMSSPM